MNDAAERKLALSHLWVAFIAFVVACFMGEYQVLERSGFIPLWIHPVCILPRSVPMGY